VKQIRFNKEKRILLKEYLGKGLSKNEAAQKLGVHRTSIYNEIERGLDNNGEYNPKLAQERSKKRSNNKGSMGIITTEPGLAECISSLILDEKLSP